jgi:hypothetical protein
MTTQEALQVLDAEIIQLERERWLRACRVRDEAARVARDALARWTQAEKEARK